jgi:S1-C subfamily serine protease
MRARKTALIAVVAALVVSLFASAAKADVPLGIVMQNTPNGLVVRDVMPGKIADRCMPRLRIGARIVTVNGAPVTSAEQFQQVVESSAFIKFQFVDATGELRWARAWSGGSFACQGRP